MTLNQKPMVDVTNLPCMTHLQFAVTSCIPRHGISAVNLKQRIGMKGPAFYQLIERMIIARWIIRNFTYPHGKHKAAHYKTTSAGRKEMEISIDWYH